MQITIGEIVNEIIPFCAKLEMKMFNDIPFISASLKNDHNLTIGNLYVVQTKEYVYSAYASFDNIVGKHFFPSGSIYFPIMSETELIPKLFNKEIISRVEENLNLHSFVEYFYRVLYNFEITRFNPKNLDKKFVDMGFKSKNIIKNINKTFENKNIEEGTIRELLWICNHESFFMLGPLKSKETHIIELKLKDIGLYPIISNNKIYALKLDRFHKRSEKKIETNRD